MLRFRLFSFQKLKSLVDLHSPTTIYIVHSYPTFPPAYSFVFTKSPLNLSSPRIVGLCLSPVPINDIAHSDRPGLTQLYFDNAFSILTYLSLLEPSVVIDLVDINNLLTRITPAQLLTLNPFKSHLLIKDLCNLTPTHLYPYPHLGRVSSVLALPRTILARLIYLIDQWKTKSLTYPYLPSTQFRLVSGSLSYSPFNTLSSYISDILIPTSSHDYAVYSELTKSSSIVVPPIRPKICLLDCNPCFDSDLVRDGNLSISVSLYHSQLISLLNYISAELLTDFHIEVALHPRMNESKLHELYSDVAHSYSKDTLTSLASSTLVLSHGSTTCSLISSINKQNLIWGFSELLLHPTLGRYTQATAKMLQQPILLVDNKHMLSRPISNYLKPDRVRRSVDITSTLLSSPDSLSISRQELFNQLESAL